MPRLLFFPAASTPRRRGTSHHKPAACCLSLRFPLLPLLPSPFSRVSRALARAGCHFIFASTAAIFGRSRKPASPFSGSWQATNVFNERGNRERTVANLFLRVTTKNLSGENLPTLPKSTAELRFLTVVSSGATSRFEIFPSAPCQMLESIYYNVLVFKTGKNIFANAHFLSVSLPLTHRVRSFFKMTNRAEDSGFHKRNAHRGVSNARQSPKIFNSIYSKG